MSLKELLVLVMIYIIWGLHFPIMRVTVENSAEPFFYAALRMTIVAIILTPKLKWHHGQMRNILLAGVGFGGLNYAFGFPAMEFATASAAAITIELYVPFSIILSIIFLGERVGLPRMFGIALAFAGICIVSLSRPPEATGEFFVLGVVMVALAALSEAFGAIMVKTVKSVGPLQLLAWFAVVGSIILWPLSFALEDNQLDAFSHDNRKPFIMALLYSVLLVSLVAHASYYWLLSRLPIYLVAGTGFMCPMVAVTAGVILLDEPLSWALFIGASMTLAGVTMILMRNAKATQTPPLPES